MGDVSGHLADGGETLGLDQLGVGAADGGDHSFERGGKFADLVGRSDDDAGRQIAAGHGLGAIGHRGERTKHLPRAERHPDADRERQQRQADEKSDRPPFANARGGDQIVHLVLDAVAKIADSAGAVDLVGHELVLHPFGPFRIARSERVEQTGEHVAVGLQEALDLARLLHELDAELARMGVARGGEPVIHGNSNLGERLGPDAPLGLDPAPRVARVSDLGDVIEVDVDDVLRVQRALDRRLEGNVARPHELGLGGGTPFGKHAEERRRRKDRHQHDVGGEDPRGDAASFGHQLFASD